MRSVEAGSVMRSVGTLVALGAAVLAVYWPEANEQGERLLRGMDYEQLHLRRIAFAQDALFDQRRGLPAWYPRELLGTPFWSNVQSFPFIPTRLVLLPWLDPLHLFTGSVWVSAVLSAWFTFAYCRRVSMARVGAAVAGWTFAAAGFFAARVLAGHLPLLEAYPALPLLLWLSEAALQAGGDPPRLARWIVTLAGSCTAVSLAGHPQLPVYALSISGIYALFRGWRSKGTTIRMLGAMALGVGSAAFALLPMLLLIGRSTRVLPLDRAGNDLVFPYDRLGAFFLPWKDGWPGVVARSPALEFHGHATPAYFWDTACYVGWMPWLALLLLLATPTGRRALGQWPWRFWWIVGAGALVLSLPWWQPVLALIPGTFLRSASRQLYLVTFALAMMLGLGIDLLSKTARERDRARAAAIAVAVAVGIHAVDLVRHDRAFVVAAPHPRVTPPDEMERLNRFVGDARVAIDYSFYAVFERPWDDVGFFDSIVLARPYRALLDLIEAPPTLNVQQLDGGLLTRRALQAAGVKLVVTRHERGDLPALPMLGEHAHRVGTRAARAALFPSSRVRRLEVEEIHALLRDPKFDPHEALLIPSSAPEPPRAEGAAGAEPSVAYTRPSSDRIAVTVATAEPGWLRVLEAFDPGWAATLDGRSVPIVAGNDFLLAVAVPPGDHELLFDYTTPGATTGRGVSYGCLLALLALVAPLGMKRGSSTSGATSSQHSSSSIPMRTSPMGVSSRLLTRRAPGASSNSTTTTM